MSEPGISVRMDGKTLGLGDMTPAQRVEAFAAVMDQAAKLLRAIKPETIAEALANDRANGAVNVLMERRKAWRVAFDEIANEIEEHFRRVQQGRGEVQGTLTLIDQVARATGKDFREGVAAVERLIALCEKVKALQADGTLRAVCATIRGDEVPTA